MVAFKKLLVTLFAILFTPNFGQELEGRFFHHRRKTGLQNSYPCKKNKQIAMGKFFGSLNIYNVYVPTSGLGYGGVNCNYNYPTASVFPGFTNGFYQGLANLFSPVNPAFTPISSAISNQGNLGTEEIPAQINVESMPIESPTNPDDVYDPVYEDKIQRPNKQMAPVRAVIGQNSLIPSINRPEKLFTRIALDVNRFVRRFF